MKGVLQLPGFTGNYFVVGGGSFYHAPKGTYRVKLAKEVSALYETKIDIPDFSTPKPEQVDAVLPLVVKAIGLGKPVYAGCMGGIGRTGLFLALLAKAWGVEDPVGYVRRHYYAHAVETPAQVKFIHGYSVPFSIKRSVFFLKLKTLFRKGCLTDTLPFDKTKHIR